MMIQSPYFSGTKMARTISFLRAHKRVVTFSLVAFGAFWLTQLERGGCRPGDFQGGSATLGDG
jgi:hypothetical protein